MFTKFHNQKGGRVQKDYKKNVYIYDNDCFYRLILRFSVLFEMFVTSISFRGTFKSFWDLTGKSTILVQRESLDLNTVA